MAWVNVNGHRYYRRSRRVGGRVVIEHIGGGRFGAIVAEWDASHRELRRLERFGERLDADLFLLGIQDCLAVDEAVASLFTLMAGISGAYRHRRQWRWHRGGKAMASKKTKEAAGTLAALKEPAIPPLMDPDFSGIPEQDQAVLRAAANGDAAALEQSRKYLTDRSYTRRWGNPVYAARCWLVGQSCGHNQVVARATHNHAEQLAGDLGGASATALEKLAITRIVNNWLMVGVLEVKACGWRSGTRERALAERCLTQAERRLLQAVKMLAFLRGVSAAQVLTRLPLATTTVPKTTTVEKPAADSR
jgi:hypothetical protein